MPPASRGAGRSAREDSVRGQLKVKRIDQGADSVDQGNHRGPLWKLVDRVLAQDGDDEKLQQAAVILRVLLG